MAKPTTLTPEQVAAFRAAVRSYYDYTHAAGLACRLFPEWQEKDLVDTIQCFGDGYPDDATATDFNEIAAENILECFEPVPPAPVVPILDLTPNGAYADRRPIYRFQTSYPWVLATPTVRPTPHEAQADAQAWLTQYKHEAPYARMGAVLGAAVKDGGYVGVVNYYHSNS